jgi:hypothetical protein
MSRPHTWPRLLDGEARDMGMPQRGPSFMEMIDGMEPKPPIN